MTGAHLKMGVIPVRYYRKVKNITDIAKLQESAKAEGQVGVGLSDSGKLYIYENRLAVEINVDRAASILQVTPKEIEAWKADPDNYKFLDESRLLSLQDRPEMPAVVQIKVEPTQEPVSIGRDVVEEHPATDPQKQAIPESDLLQLVKQATEEITAIKEDVRSLKAGNVPQLLKAIDEKLDKVLVKIDNFYL